MQRLREILENNFAGNIGAMAAFLEVNVGELEGMLNGTIPIPDWVWEKLIYPPAPKPPEPEPPQQAPGLKPSLDRRRRAAPGPSPSD